MPRPKKTESGEAAATVPSQSTLAVDKVIADRIRDMAKEAGATKFEVTQGLLEYALEHAKFEVQVRKVVIGPKRGK